jgi:hypothetical protein
VAKPKVYLETTIVSYLTARRSRDLVVAAHQEFTAEWWNEHRSRFSLFVSDLVVQKARHGDPEAADRRLTELRGITRRGEGSGYEFLGGEDHCQRPNQRSVNGLAMSYQQSALRNS